MAEETRNYIEQTQARAMAVDGKELSPDEMAREFAKRDLTERVDILDNLDRDISGAGDLSIEQAAKLHRYTSSLRRMNDVLRRVGR